MLDSGHFFLNPSTVASPPVNGLYKIYFADRADTVKLTQQQWESLQVLSRQQPSLSLTEFAATVDYPLTPHANLNDYWQWLIESGVLVPPSGAADAAASSDSVVQHQDGRSSRRQPIRVDLQPFFQSIPVAVGRQCLAVQLSLWPFALALFAIVFGLFYISPNSAWRALAATEINPLSSVVRILLMFLVVNISSVFAINVMKRAVGYHDYIVTFILKWGLFPAFTTRLQFKRVRDLCSQREGTILYAQPMLVRVYLCTASMLLLFPASTFAASWPPALLIFLRTLQQATILGLLIDCLPILSNSLVRLLIFYHVLEPDYLASSFKAFVANGTAILSGDFASLTQKRLSLLFVISLIAVTLKILFIYTRILPSFAGDLPPIFGQFTSDLIKLVLAIFLFRFCYQRLLPRLTGRPSSVGPSGSAPQASAPGTPSAQPAVRQGLRRFNRQWFRSNQFRIALVLVILLFPFHATISGASTVVEGQSVELRTINAGRVAQIFHLGPSDAVLEPGTALVRIQSDALDASISSNEQDLASSRSQIKRVASDLQSLQKGSKYQELSDLDDQLLSTRAQLNQYRQSLLALRAQIDLSDESVRAYQALSLQGAVSDVQLRAFQMENLTLKDSYLQTLEKANQLNAQVRIAQRAKTLGQGLSRNEELLKTEESLVQAKSQLAKASAVQSKLAVDRKSLTLTMPFKGVISSSTKDLLHRSVVSGEALLTVKSIPLTSVRVLIPEYDRYRIRDGLQAVVRLYADSMSEFSGRIQNVNPTTVTENGVSYAEATIAVQGEIPDHFVGSKGAAKIMTGVSCLATEILRPLVMFFRLDIWKYLPWV